MGIKAKSTLTAIVVCALALGAIFAMTAFTMNDLLRIAALGVLESDLDEATEEAMEGDYKEAIENVDSSMVQIVAADGTVLASSPRIRTLSSMADAVGVGEQYEIDDLDSYSHDPSPWLSQGAPYLMTERILRTEDETVTIVALTSIRSGVETISGTLSRLAIVFLIALVAIGFLVWSLANRTLKPVEIMRRETESINAGNLSARIDVPESDPDLARLATTLNDLLARIERASNEQKQFVSDASHELKSPIAASSVILEALREHGESIDLDQALADLDHENRRLASIVADLLTIARQDEGRLVAEMAPVDLMDLMYAEVQHAKQPASNLTFDMSGLRPVVCNADKELLSHAVRNLVENAVRYARTTVSVSCCEENGTVRITVSDDGPGIPAQQRERVFGRFVRLEDSLKRPSGSTGLGLPVVRGIANRHGGDVRFKEPQLGGATAVIEFPAASS